ncbi:MAG: glycosyltransferase family 2 protein, partial [Prevotella sp.]|nr:glycosyltransferase family 2 protein [Prevotella sp.]
IKTVTTAFDDKELEIRLLRQHIYIDYFDDIMVFEEKARNAEDFNRQRRRWLLSQFTTIFRNILYLPGAIFTKHYNLMDKIIQWMLLPRLALIAVILFMSVVMPFIYFSLALKWWVLFGFVFFVFALATPNYLVDEKWDKTFYMAPLIFLSSILSKTILGKRLKAYTNQKL